MYNIKLIISLVLILAQASLMLPQQALAQNNSGVENAMLAPKIYLQNSLLQQSLKASTQYIPSFVLMPETEYRSAKASAKINPDLLNPGEKTLASMLEQKFQDVSASINPDLLTSFERTLASLKQKDPFMSQWRNTLESLSGSVAMHHKNSYYTLTVLYMKEQYGQVNF